MSAREAAMADKIERSAESRSLPVVLLIEDDRANTRLCQVLLASSGSVSVTLECAGTLEAGLQRIARGRIDLVLLDLGLPDSRGIDTLRAVRAAAPGVPVIVMSGFDDDESSSQAMQEGAMHYIVKGELGAGGLERLILRALGGEKRPAA
jgi:DNA-binding response OmpR family regulator